MTRIDDMKNKILFIGFVIISILLVAEHGFGIQIMEFHAGWLVVIYILGAGHGAKMMRHEKFEHGHALEQEETKSEKIKA